MTPQELIERVLAASRSDDCVAIVAETSSANLRWAGNTLTTNGVYRARQLTVVAISRGPDGARVGVVSRAGPRGEQVADIVEAAEKAAAEGSPAEDEQPLLLPGDGVSFSANGAGAGPGWDGDAAATGVGVFSAFSGALGEAFEAASGGGRKLYGFAEHDMTSTFLGTSTGLRLRHDQPAGKVEVNAKSADLTRSAWAGQATRDFTDVDVAGLTSGLARQLGWARRHVDLPAGRYETLLSPSAMADLYVYMWWTSGAKEALDGRTVFSKAGGGTRVGERLATMPLTLRSDPGAPGLQCGPFALVTASGRDTSVFDNGLALHPTAWLRDGELTALRQSRHTADLSGLPVTPAIGNLIMDGPPGASGTTDDLVARTQRGLLVTSLWYIREVDPQTMLLTGLTRDGVYLVEDGEVTGAVNNFRFNESPVGMLARISEAGGSVRTLPREWSDHFTRCAFPPGRVDGFHMSSVSQAS